MSELHKICVKGDSGSRYFCGSAWVILNMIQTIQRLLSRDLILLGEHGGYIRKAHSLRDSLTATAFIPEVVCIKRDMAAVRSRFDQQAGWESFFFFGSSHSFVYMELEKRLSTGFQWEKVVTGLKIIIANWKQLDAAVLTPIWSQFFHIFYASCQVNDIKSLQRMLHSFERQGPFPQLKTFFKNVQQKTRPYLGGLT